MALTSHLGELEQPAQRWTAAAIAAYACSRALHAIGETAKVAERVGTAMRMAPEGMGDKGGHDGEGAAGGWITSRGPQSVQSEPYPQLAYSLPGPPSLQRPFPRYWHAAGSSTQYTGGGEGGFGGEGGSGGKAGRPAGVEIEYMSYAPQLFSPVSVPHSPSASQSVAPGRTFLQFGMLAIPNLGHSVLGFASSVRQMALPVS